MIPGKGNIPELRKDEFWAVNDISFELKRGECLGLIGHNGAGKSTLLKMLNGLIKPDHGRITMKGRIGALIELNAGFNPILTGRENVYIYGAILGFTKDEIDSKYEAIVEFAEMNNFMEMPFRSYSSGMKVRLGFAVAAQMEPDVLIIDEVLAVGDMGFILKSLNRMDEILRNAAVVFVSHNMPLVYRVSNNLILMNKGRACHSGDVSEGIDRYHSMFAPIASFLENQNVEIISITINDLDAIEKPVQLHRLSDMVINLHLKISLSYQSPSVALIFYDKELKGVAEYFHKDGLLSNEKGILKLKYIFEKILFSKGVYSFTVLVMDGERGKILLRAQSVAYFQVIAKRNIWTAFELEGQLSQYE
nr:ABC transporter ATP-binding protein [uncultured Desulfobacter sp.]